MTQKIVDQIKGIEEKGFVKKSAKTPFQTKFDLSQAHIGFDIKSQENDLKIEFSNSKNEVFKIEIKRNQLITDRKKSGLVDFEKTFAEKSQTMDLRNQRIRNIQLYLDHSSVEIILNDREFSFTNLFFPTESYSDLKINSSKIQKLTNFKINSIKSIWK